MKEKELKNSLERAMLVFHDSRGREEEERKKIREKGIKEAKRGNEEAIFTNFLSFYLRYLLVSFLPFFLMKLLISLN